MKKTDQTPTGPRGSTGSDLRHRIGAVAMALTVGMLSVRAMAATDVTWTGTTDTDFSNDANWIATAPADDLTTSIGVFEGTPTANQPVLSENRSVNGLRLSTAGGGWTLGDATYTLAVGSGGISTVGQSSGTNTISANLSISATQTWKVGSGGLLDITGALGGSSNLTVGSSGNVGTAMLSGVNTYSGSTTVSYGTLVLNSSGTAVKGNVGVSSGATLKLAGSGGNQIDDARNITANGTVDLNGTSEVINQLGGTTGTITNGAAGAAKLTVKNGSSFSGVVQDGVGTVALQMNNQTLTLSGDNSYSGGTTMAGGTLVVGSDTAAGTGLITMGAGTVRAYDATDRVLVNDVTLTNNQTFGSSTTGNLTFGNVSRSGNASLTVSNSLTTFANLTIAGGTINKNGTGSLVVSGNYTQSGSTSFSINSGALAAAGVYSNVVVAKLNSGTLGRNGSLTGNLNGGGSVAWSSNATGGLFAFGANATWGDAANNFDVNFGGSGATITWNGTGSGFVSSAATLLLGHVLSNGTITLHNAVNLNGATQTIAVTRGTINTAGGADAELAGIISNGGLNITGDGVLLLSATNAYTGGTSVTDATLLVNGSVVGPVTVNAGGTLGGSGAIGGDAVVNGTLSPGNSPGLITFDASLTLGGGSTTRMEIGEPATRGATFDAVDVGTLLTYGGDLVLDITGAYPSAQWDLFDFADYGGNLSSVSLTGSYAASLTLGGTTWTGIVGDQQWSFEQTTGVLAVVPEPASMALLGVGGLAMLKRR